jgi:capsid protein
MTEGSETARRDALLARRLNLISSVSALTAEALRLNQKRAGIEMEMLRLELEIGRSGASAQLVRDLHEAEQNAATIIQACAACEDRIVAAEGDVEDVDRRLAATADET